MHFFPQKVELILVVALKRRSKGTKRTSKSPPPSKNVLPGDALGVLGAHLQILPINYAYNFFSPPWEGAGALTDLPWLRL